MTATVEVAGRSYDVEVYRRSGDDRREVAVAMPTFNALDISVEPPSMTQSALRREAA